MGMRYWTSAGTCCLCVVLSLTYVSQWVIVCQICDRFSTQTPGRFVEVGAQDGEFMSLTAHLEALHFEGLLIEPNPYDYAKLRARRRHAMTINACASPYDITAKVRRTLSAARSCTDRYWPVRYRYWPVRTGTGQSALHVIMSLCR